MTSTLHVLDATGDTRIEWDPKSKDEVRIARKAFEEAKSKKMLTYKVRADGSAGEQIREFDPNAERIIATRQLVGG